MAALALNLEVGGEDELAVARLTLVEHEYEPPANDSRYPHARKLAIAPRAIEHVPALTLYEEFHPYGTSAYRAVDSSVDVSARRYRYSGMERDDETGLGYHTARYYASWLGRWTASDPIGLAGGGNRFAYCGGNPASKSDPNGRLAGDPLWPVGHDSSGGVQPVAEAPIPEFLPGDSGGVVSFDDADDVVGHAPVAAGTDPEQAATAQRQYEEDLARAQNVDAPGEAYGMRPALVGPYLRDQSSGIQDDFLRFHASYVQTEQRRIVVIGTRVAAVAQIGADAASLGGSVRLLRSAAQGLRSLKSAALQLRRTANTASETQGALSNLGNSAISNTAETLSQFKPGSAFSGVFHPGSGRLLAVPSGGTRFAAGGRPPNLVPRRGGHFAVEEQLNNLTGAGRGENVGFTVHLEEDGSLGVEFLSRSVNGPNPAFPGAEAPPELQEQVLAALRAATGRTASAR